MPVLATSHVPFYICGGALAAWALILTALGVASKDFPPKGLEKVIMGISVLLVIGAIGTAIATGGEGKKGPEVANKANKTGNEGSGAPSQGGTPAPGTGSGNGQSTGPGKKPAGTAASQTLKLSADPTQLKFNTTALTAKTGSVAIVMNNPSQIPHNISLQGPGVNLHGPTVPHGGSSQVTAKLKPGKYTFYCSVPGHRQAGMQGTLTVQ